MNRACPIIVHMQYASSLNPYVGMFCNLDCLGIEQLPAASCAGAAAYESAVPKEGSFIPRLLAAKYKLPGQEPKSLTDAQIVAQAYTLILAG